MRFKSPVVDVAIRLCCRCNLRSISTSHVTIHALLPLVQLLNIFHITAHFVALDFIATHFHMYICSARSFVSFAVAIFAPRFQNSVVFFRKTTTNVPLCHACFCLTARNSVIINVVTKWEVSCDCITDYHNYDDAYNRFSYRRETVRQLCIFVA